MADKGKESPVILVCGGRDFNDREVVFGALDLVHWSQETIGVEKIIQGGATGADALAREWARLRDVPCVTVPAQWDRYGKRAGPMRNQEMLDMKPSFVLAFPGGKGTENMIKLACKAGVQILKPA